jgi:hypothetical protein
MTLTKQQATVLKIYQEALAQGQRMGRNRLAKASGLSADVVRHALIALNALGLIGPEGSPPPALASLLPDAKPHGTQWQEYAEDGTDAKLTATMGHRPKNIDELIAACAIDMEVWVVEKWVCNKWEQAAKFVEGKASRIVVTPLYQVKAWLKRKQADRLVVNLPDLQTLHCTVKPVKLPLPAKRPYKACLVIPDMHIGFYQDGDTLEPLHDRQAIDAVLQLAYRLQPERIVFLGDIMDVPDWSDKFLSSPEFHNCFQPTLYEAGWLMAKTRQLCPKAQITVIPGNHDDRIRRTILSHRIHLYGIKPANVPDAPPLLSLTNLLGLHTLKIDCVDDYPHGVVWINPSLKFTHGSDVSQVPGGSVGKTLKRGRAHSDGYGHTHHLEQAHRTTMEYDGPRTVSAYSLGSLVKLDGKIPAASAEKNWQNACGIFWHDDEVHYPDLLPIHQGQLLWGGVLIKGQDYVQHMRKDTGYNF